LKIILGDNNTYPVKGFGNVKFDLDYGESVILHELMYVLELKKNLISISYLEEKEVRVSFINGKVFSWSKVSRMRDAFTPRSSVEGLYKVNGKPLLAMVHNTDH